LTEPFQTGHLDRIMTPSSAITYWNRSQKKLETEKVYGDALVKWLYGSRTGYRVADLFFVSPWLSKVVGAYQDTALSSKRIPEFVKQYEIPMEQYEGAEFRTFNDFFIRKFRSGMRTYPQDAGAMGAPAEARYLAFDRITDTQTFPVKGYGLSAVNLLGSREVAKPFIGGPLLLARLCPVDYHRFHFPDDGRELKQFRVEGQLHSVNPMALRASDEVFIRNERQVSILETKNFGKLAYIEVGALCVGKIVQSWDAGQKDFKRGDEKGYFLFGGSTVIVLGEPGAWQPDADLLENTRQGRECLVRLGEPVARSQRLSST
jgi:phosphatidylserine decarboxylase